MDETNGITSRINELTNILGQFGDIDAKLKAGIIDQGEYLELKARQLAYTKALDALADGQEVDDDALEALLDEMREVAAQPTQEEINAADIAYLMMIGGEE